MFKIAYVYLIFRLVGGLFFISNFIIAFSTNASHKLPPNDYWLDCRALHGSIVTLWGHQNLCLLSRRHGLISVFLNMLMKGFQKEAFPKGKKNTLSFLKCQPPSFSSFQTKTTSGLICDSDTGFISASMWSLCLCL